jgi:hypothetical protein
MRSKCENFVFLRMSVTRFFSITDGATSIFGIDSFIRLEQHLETRRYLHSLILLTWTVFLFSYSTRTWNNHRGNMTAVQLTSVSSWFFYSFFCATEAPKCQNWFGMIDELWSYQKRILRWRILFYSAISFFRAFSELFGCALLRYGLIQRPASYIFLWVFFRYWVFTSLPPNAAKHLKIFFFSSRLAIKKKNKTREWMTKRKAKLKAFWFFHCILFFIATSVFSFSSFEIEFSIALLSTFHFLFFF